MVIIKETSHERGRGVGAAATVMGTRKSGHESAFQGIANIGILVVSVRRFLHRRNGTIYTIYWPCLGPRVATDHGPGWDCFDCAAILTSPRMQVGHVPSWVTDCMRK